jgi:hypothetical protein
MSVFQSDLNAAMSFKGQFPATTVIVSMEHSHSDHDSFWSDASVESAISLQTIVLRLTESDTPESFRQFQLIFRIDSVPSLVVFGPNTAKVSRQWDTYPSVGELVDFLRPSITLPPPPPPRPARPPSRTVRIALQGPSGGVNKDFERTTTVAELKDWLRAEVGPDYQVIVGHTQQPLPDDDSMTLVQADLAPSSVLRVVSGDILEAEILIDRPGPVRATQPLLVEQTRRRCQCCRAGAIGRVRKWAAVALSLLNPWAEDDPDEQFLEYKPNPERLRQIHESARLMRRWQRQQERQPRPGL